MRSIATVAVVVTWLALLTALVRQEEAPSTAPLIEISQEPLPAGTRDEWFGIYQGKRKIGWAHRAISSTASGITMRDDSDLRLALLGSEQHVRTVLVAQTDQSFALRGFRFRLVSDAATFTAEGTVEPSRLVVRHGTGKAEQTLELPLSEPIHLPTTLRPRLALASAPDGSRFTASVFSPLSMKSEPITVRVEGRETIERPEGPVEAVRVAEEQQGFAARAWLAKDGTVLREEATLGFRLERETPELAMADVTGAPVDLAIESRIPLHGQIDQPRETEQLTLRVGGAAAGRVPNDPPRQRLEADVLRIEREALPGGSVSPGAEEPSELTKPSPFIESDDAEIVALAREIAGDETDRAVVARRLVEWVSHHVEQEPSVTIPSARAVLAAKRGDCNEHAVLVAALARAAGIPARVVAGAVYANDGFYFHAWNELWLDGWVSADAIFAQLPADATHVKLLEGGPEKHLELADIVGRLEFTRVETPS